MSFEIKKPYKEKARLDFIVEYSHKQGLKIKETEQAIYALERDEIMVWVDVEEKKQVETEPAVYDLETGELIKEAVYETQTVTVPYYKPVINPNYEEEQAEKERERISMLFLTAADVERGLYKALGKDFEDIISIASNVAGVDVKALKIELKANNFYRGNPYVNQMGLLLGLTEKQLDEFFETNDYTKLIGDTLSKS